MGSSWKARWALVVIGSASLLGGCSDPAEITVRSSAEVFVLPQSASIQGRDGGASGLLWGRSVWAFGDTVLTTPDEAGSTWHHNSFSFTSDLDASDGIDGFVERNDAVGAPLYLVAPTDDEAAFNAAHDGDSCAEMPCRARWACWPGEPIFDEARSRAIVPYGLIYAEPGDFNFRGVGQSFAIWSDEGALPERPVVDASKAHPTLLFDEDEPGYGIAPNIRDDQLYSFACTGDGFDKPCTLGRVPLENLFDRAAWQHWDGDAWSSDIGDAEELFEGADIMGVHWNAHLGRFTAIYSDPGSNDVVVRTAPELWGPWSDEATLFTADRKTEEGWVYDAMPHAELAEEDGRILYVSFSRPTGIGWFGAELAVVRVELE